MKKAFSIACLALILSALSMNVFAADRVQRHDKLQKRDNTCISTNYGVRDQSRLHLRDGSCTTNPDCLKDQIRLNLRDGSCLVTVE